MTGIYFSRLSKTREFGILFEISTMKSRPMVLKDSIYQASSPTRALIARAIKLDLLLIGP